MCGISISKLESPQDHFSLEHRGTQSTYTSISVKGRDYIVYHNRLPIEGIGRRAQQPIVTEKSMTWLVGEVYNYPRDQYNSDTHWVSDVLDSVGPKFWERENFQENMLFKGMYSIFYHEIETGLLYIYIDPLSKKPIYWDRLMNEFSSEIKGLPRSTRLAFSENYLSFIESIPSISKRYPYPDLTPYLSISKLHPGVYCFDGACLTYAYTGIGPGSWRGTFSICDQDFTSLVIQAAKIRNMSPVPTGILCSGGLDSSLLYWILRENTDLTVFHIENGEDDYLDLLDIPSDRLVKIDYPTDMDHDLLVDILRTHETPMDLGSIVPQYLLSKAVKEARPEIKVLITGDGADELFAGYRRALSEDTFKLDDQELKVYHIPRLDKMGMRFTLEIRCPYLDESIYTYAKHTPWERKRGKQQIKQVARELGLPTEIIDREKIPLKSPSLKADKTAWQEHLLSLWKENFLTSISKI